jgi:putative transposase
MMAAWRFGLARKQKGSAHQRQARQTLAHVHRQIACQRQAWHWDTARALCTRYDTIYLEDLELRGMTAMWGRKVANLGFGRFVQVLHQAADKLGTHVHHIDRFFPSTKRCHVCGFPKHAVTLRDRLWACPCCGTVHRGASSCARGRCQTISVAATV